MLQLEYLSPESEIDPNVLWREGLSNQRKVMWTPRVLIFDLKSNWGSHFSALAQSSLPRKAVTPAQMLDLNKELNKTEKEVHWDRKVERIVEQDETFLSKRKAETLNEKKKTPGSQSQGESSGRMEVKGEEPQSWNDYTQWKLHSSQGAAFSLSDFTHNSVLGVLPNYEQGLQIYSLIQEEVMDGIRHYAEACDYLEVGLAFK